MIYYYLDKFMWFLFLLILIYAFCRYISYDVWINHEEKAYSEDKKEETKKKKKKKKWFLNKEISNLLQKQF